MLKILHFVQDDMVGDPRLDRGCVEISLGELGLKILHFVQDDNCGVELSVRDSILCLYL